MTPDSSDHAFEHAIECALLEQGPDAHLCDATMAREPSPADGEIQPAPKQLEHLFISHRFR